MKPEWEAVTRDPGVQSTTRLKVEGGHLYFREDAYDHGNESVMCFVPDVDLQRYSAHLRDAYKTGYEEGYGDAKRGVVNPEEGLYGQ